MNTVGTRLTIATILPLVLVVITGFLVYRLQARPFIVGEYGKDIEATLDLKQFFIEQWVQERLQMVEYLSRTPAARSWTIHEMNESSNRFVSSFPEFTAAVFVDPSGEVVADSQGRPGGFVGDRGYFRTAIDGRPNVSEVLTGRTTGKKIVIFAAPVRDTDEEVIGMVFAPIGLDTIESIIVDLSIRTAIYTTLVDRRGVPVATNLPASLVDVAERSEPYSAANNGANLYTAAPDLEFIAGRREIATAGWSLIVEARLSDLTRIFRIYTTTMLTSLLGVAVVLAFFATWITRSIVRPITLLERMGRTIGTGRTPEELGARFPRRAPVELHNLKTSLIEMATVISYRQLRLRKESYTDPLTQIANRRFLDTVGVHLVRRCALSERPCSVLMIDIDRFKRINDTYGHETGDRVLTAFAAMLTATCREDDLVARYGGEEFVVILPGTECMEARQFAERFRVQVATTDLVPGERITCSTGVSEIFLGTASHPSVRPPVEPSAASTGATTSENDITTMLKEAIARADTCLYKAKKSGRDRVCSPCDEIR
ncbi:MAG: diguanylate cyclase [Alkalispirochaeta sp.]